MLSNKSKRPSKEKIVEELLKWTDQNHLYGSYAGVQFDGKSAFATDNYQLAIVKNFHADESHVEFRDGHMMKATSNIDFYKVIPNKEEIDWKISLLPSETKKVMRDWSNIFNSIKKMNTDGSKFAIYKSHSSFYCCAHNEDICADYMLLYHPFTFGKKNEKDWSLTTSINFFLNAFSLMKLFKTNAFKFYVSTKKGNTTICIETDELIFVTSSNTDIKHLYELNEKRFEFFMGDLRRDRKEPEKYMNIYKLH